MAPSFLEQACSGKRLTSVWLAIPGSVIILIASIIGGQLLFQPLIPLLFGTSEEIQSSLFSGGLVQALRELTELGPAIFMIWIIVRFHEQRDFKSLGLQRQGMWRQLATGAVAGFGLMAVFGLVGYLTGALVPEETRLATDGLGLGFVFVFFGVLVQTSAEEIIFRGWLLQVLTERWGYLVAAIIASVVFAAPHALNDDITPLALVNVLLLSFFFALWVWYQQSLWALIGFHWFYNWTQFSVIGLDVTEQENLGGAIFNLAYTDNVPFITGGSVAEDGPFMTIVALTGIAVLMWLKRRRTEI